MRAIVHDRPGGEEVLRIDTLPSPAIGPDDVRISVAAAGVNRADIVQRRGLYPPPPGASPILGLECAGTIAEVGDNVSGLHPGDRAMALLTGGGYADEAVVDARCVMAVPPEFTDVQAAATPEVFLTAFLNLFEVGRLAAGDTVLVHGGSGGVGTAAIQLAAHAGARVIVTAGSGERCARCVELGASAAVNYRTDDFAARTLELTAGKGVNVVLDCIGASYLAKNLSALAADGRLVVIGLMGGADAALDLGTLLRRRLTIIGSTLRGRAAADKGRIIDGFLARFGRALREGVVGPIVDRALPLHEAATAHRLMVSGEIFGKVILTTE